MISANRALADRHNRTSGQFATTRPTIRPLVVVLIILMLALSGAYFYPDPSLLKPTIVFCLAILYFLLTRAFMRPVTLVPGIPSLLTVESLFLLFYFMLFYAPYQNYLLFNDSLSYSKYFLFAFAEESQQAIILSTIGAIAFCLGVDGPRRKTAPRARPQKHRLRLSDPAALANVVLVVLLLTSITIYISLGLKNANEARYTGAAVGGSTANIYDLIVLCSVMLIAQLGGALQRGRISATLVIGLAVAGAWGLRLLVAGDRNNFFLIATAAAVVVATYKVRLRLVVLIAMFAGALVLYNAVEVVRSSSSASLSSIYDQALTGEPSNRQSGDSSFSTTTTTVRAAVATVPEHVSWGMGRYKVLGIVGIVPFARGLFWPSGVDTSADVLSRAILGGFSSWSVGTSIVADCYMDFGLPGVAGFLFLIGWIGRRIQDAAITDPHSSLTRCTYIICVAYFSEYPRYSFEFPVNALVWGSSLLLVIKFLYFKVDVSR